MPWSGGQFTRVYNWVTDKNAGIPITASRMDADSNDFTSGINNCLAKDGSNTPTANLNIGSFRLTAVGTATALTDAPTMNQLQAGVTNWGVAGGTADALTLTLSPAQTTIADGTLVGVRAALANVSTTPTFAFNATTARTITRLGGAALRAGSIPGQFAEMFLRYNSANTRWELLNPAPVLTILGKSGAAVSAPADTTEDILATITVPANAVGANGAIRFTFNCTFTNNGNVKTLRMRYSGIGGTLIVSQAVTNKGSITVSGMMMNANATGAQSWNYVGVDNGGGILAASPSSASAIDTTAATTIVITGQKATAGDAFTIVNYNFLLDADGT